MTAPYWGNVTFSNGERVPLVTHRCTEQPKHVGNAHKCRMVTGHTSLHRCICGKKWDQSGEMVS